MRVVKLLPFCLFKKGTDAQDLGIANGYFAGTAWCESDERYEGISGRKFGWMDSRGVTYCDNKDRMTRPTEAEVIKFMDTHPFFCAWCVEEGLIKY